FPIEREVARVTADAVRAFEDAGATVDEVRLKFPRGQAELCDAWLRQSAVRAAESAESLKESTGIDLRGSHRNEVPPEFAESLDLGHRLSALDYRRDDVIRTEVLDGLQDVFDDYDLIVSPTLAALPVDNATNGNTLGPREIEGERVDPWIGWCLTYLSTSPATPPRRSRRVSRRMDCRSASRSPRGASPTRHYWQRAGPSRRRARGPRPINAWRSADPRQRHHRTDAVDRQLRVAQESRLVGQHEDVRQVR